MVLTSPMGDPWRQAPRVTWRKTGLDETETVETDRCRYGLSLRVKVRAPDGWTPIAHYVRPPPAPFVGETRTLKPGETFTITIPPTPQELSLWTATSRMGPYVPPDLAGKCPVLSGSIWFEPEGVYVDMPWSAGDLVIPGIRRDPGARVTTLIFQKPECRLELSVHRDIHDDAGWQASPLSPFPGSGGRE